MINYAKLEDLLAKAGLTKSQLGEALSISSRTIAKIGKGQQLSTRTLQKIGDYLRVAPSDLFVEQSDNALLQALRDEKDARISGGIYHNLQVRMTFNSNHMEGSRLSEDQTRMIFETRTVDVGDGVSVDDIMETIHHFRAIDYCIDHAEEPLSQSMIKELHYILKHDTKDAMLPWFAVGDYKKRPNTVGHRETTPPAKVADTVQALLDAYLEKTEVTIQDIIAFHAQFEQIHPFQDGNGRVGRLIAFKECLKHNIVPFIIEDRKKHFYYRGLANWDTETGWLVDTCLDGQDTMRRILNYFTITAD